MDTDELILLLLCSASFMATGYLIYRIFSSKKSVKKKKVKDIGKQWAEGSLLLVGFLIMLSLANFTSGEGFGALNGVFWLVVIGPVVVVSYFIYHVGLLIGGKKRSESERQNSMAYVIVVLVVALLGSLYPVLRGWKDRLNKENYQKGLRDTCVVIDNTNKEDCQKQSQQLKTYQEERRKYGPGH